MQISTGLIALFGALSLSACTTSQSNPIYQQSTVYKASRPANTTIVASQSPSQPVYVQNVSHQPIVQSSQKYQDAVMIPTTSTQVLTVSQEPHYTRISSACMSQNSSQPMNASYDTYCQPQVMRIGTIPSQNENYVSHNHFAAQNYDHNVYSANAINSMIHSDATVITRPIPNTDIPKTIGIEENTASLGVDGTPGYYAMTSETKDGFEALNNEKQTMQQAYKSSEQEDNTDQLSQETTEQTVQSASMVETDQDTLTSDNAHNQAATSRRRTTQASWGNGTHTIQPGDTVYSLARSSCIKVQVLKDANDIDDNFYIRVGDVITLPKSECK